MHSFPSSPVHLLTPSPIDAFGEYAPHLFTYSPIHLFADLPTCRLADLPTCRLADLPKRSTTHSPIASDEWAPVSRLHLCQLLQHWKMVHQPLLLSGFLKATNATHKGQPCTRPSGETAMGIPIAYPAISPRPVRQRARDVNAVAGRQTMQQRSEVSRRRSASQEQRAV